MRVTSAKAAEALERVADALDEVEQAKTAYDAWMAAWRARNGYRGPYDPVTGLPIIRQAAE